MRFSLGVNYWPRSVATAMWRRFDIGEIREDFARIAGLGLDTVRFFLRWDDFAPKPDVVDRVMLDRLDVLVAAIGEAGLQAIPTLVCGHVHGANYVPAWAVDRTAPAGRFPTISGEREVPGGVRDIYAGALLDAQLTFVRAAGERLRSHPAIRAWDIANQFSNVREPAAGREFSGEHSTEPAAAPKVADWSRRLTAALHETSSLAVTAGTHGEDVMRENNLRLATVCAPLAFASMQGSTVTSAFARNRLDPEVIPFLATLAAAFSYKPVMVTAFGTPTCPADKFSASERFAQPGEPPNMTISPNDTAFATYPCLTEHEQALWCASVLERIHQDGRLGALWWCWADYTEGLHDKAPFDRAPHERAAGIIRSDGSEKPVAAVLSAFARQARSVGPVRDMPMIATTFYYRTLPTAAKTLYDAFLGHVSERRAGGGS
ncbi:MAG: cellulase family glycosylhydrolase [Candidatus Velthaea sp.]